MQLRLPRPPRIFAARPKERAAAPALDDDPWAGEDEPWEAEAAGPRERREFLGFFRGLVLASLAGLVFWAALVVLVVRLF